MNSYQLISKLRKVRADIYLTAIEQAIYHELVSICNEKGWKDIFEVKNALLCFNLNITEKTLIKSRQLLSDAGLIYFKSCKDKRIGCCYSFSTVLSTGIITGDNTGDSIVDNPVESTGDNTVEVKKADNLQKVLSPVQSAILLAGIIPVDKNKNTVLCTGIFPVETQFTPYKRIQTINEESLAHTHEPPPPRKLKSSRKKEGDEKPLVYPFTSLRFMTVWEELRQTPKWKKKLNLALQMSLDKLGKFEEEFAIEQMDRAIESNWTGVVFPETNKLYQEWLNRKNGKSNNQIPTNSTAIASERKDSVSNLANLAGDVLRGIGAEKFK